MNIKKTFRNSIVELVKEKKFKEITIQMILDHASLSRATFYRYYKDKYDLLNDYYQYHLEQMLENKNFSSWEERLTAIYSFLLNNIEYFKKAFDVEGVNSFWNFFFNYIYSYCETACKTYKQIEELDNHDKNTILFFSAGETHLVKNWINNKNREDIQTIAKWTYEYIPNDFKIILDTFEKFPKNFK